MFRIVVKQRQVKDLADCGFSMSNHKSLAVYLDCKSGMEAENSRLATGGLSLRLVEVRVS